jgi:hypothetical protein
MFCVFLLNFVFSKRECSKRCGTPCGAPFSCVFYLGNNDSTSLCESKESNANVSMTSTSGSLGRRGWLRGSIQNLFRVPFPLNESDSRVDWLNFLTDTPR